MCGGWYSLFATSSCHLVRGALRFVGALIEFVCGINDIGTSDMASLSCHEILLLHLYTHFCQSFCHPRGIDQYKSHQELQGRTRKLLIQLSSSPAKTSQWVYPTVIINHSDRTKAVPRSHIFNVRSTSEWATPSVKDNPRSGVKWTLWTIRRQWYGSSALWRLTAFFIILRSVSLEAFAHNLHQVCKYNINICHFNSMSYRVLYLLPYAIYTLPSIVWEGKWIVRKGTLFSTLQVPSTSNVTCKARLRLKPWRLSACVRQKDTHSSL